MIRSRLSSIAVVLVLSMILIGCAEEECMDWFDNLCLQMRPPFEMGLCLIGGTMFCSVFGSGASTVCSENPDACASTYEQFQSTAIPICEEYPEECQEYFDSWVESFEEEAIQ